MRIVFEIAVVVLLVSLAGFSLMATRAKEGRYTLDHQRIVYNGGILKDKFNGYGRLRLASHDRYSGQFKDGQFSGEGVFKSHESWQYTGHFKAGVPDGKGVLTTAGHKEYHGLFKKGELIHAD